MKEDTREANSLLHAFWLNFFGSSPEWFKYMILGFLILNPIVWWGGAPFTAGWLLLAEVLICMMLATKCFPLPSMGVLMIQATALGFTTPHHIWAEINSTSSAQVMYLVIFMVAAIYFLEDFLIWFFTKILIGIKGKVTQSLIFMFSAAFLSANLDALTVAAVLITVTWGFYFVYHSSISEFGDHDYHSSNDDYIVNEVDRETLKKYRSYLFSLLMHAFVGTALGGVLTEVGEPQNKAIAEIVSEVALVFNAELGTDYQPWTYWVFVGKMLVVTLPVFVAGLLLCWIQERFPSFGRIFLHGHKMPDEVRRVLQAHQAEEERKRTHREMAKIIAQGLASVVLIVALATHAAEVGLIGLMILVLSTMFSGINDEHEFGPAFGPGMPFVGLLVVFFSFITVIHNLHLFEPVMRWIMPANGEIVHARHDEHDSGEKIYCLNDEDNSESAGFWTTERKTYVSCGLLSTVSDNVFVGVAFASQLKEAVLYDCKMSFKKFEKLCAIVNIGTNIPSIGTPNGQAAFLFLLMCSLQNLLGISYFRMIRAAALYFLVLSPLAFFLLNFL